MKHAASLKALYTLSELSKMAGIGVRSLARRLKAEGVVVRAGTRGRARVVTLIQLKEAWPDLWRSLVEMQRLEAEDRDL